MSQYGFGKFRWDGDSKSGSHDEESRAEEAKGYGMLASALVGKDKKKSDERAADKMMASHAAWQGSARAAKASREHLERINSSGDYMTPQQSDFGYGANDEYARQQAQQEAMRRRIG